MAREIVVLIFALLLVGFSQVQGSSPGLKKSQVSFLAPPHELPVLAGGYREISADVLWIRLIQDFDVCENDLTQDRDVISGPGRPAGEGEARCKQGWVFHMLDAITELAPKFKVAYDTGGSLLSVIVDDREGARIIFDKGLKLYPNDWSLNYRAGYHYLYEVKDKERAAELFRVAALNGAPTWLLATSGHLFTEVGRAEYASAILREALERQPDGPTAERMRVRLREAQEVIARSKSAPSESN